MGQTAQLTRKKDTGEPGNKGEFGTTAKADSGLTLGGPTGDGDMSVFQKRYDTMQDKLAAISAELDERVASMGNDADWQAWLETAAKFHTYSFGNQMLILMQRPDATRVAGFRTWQDLGRNVNKGERAIAILAPRVAQVESTDAAGNPVLGADGKPVKSPRVVGFRTVPVFDIAQTSGQELAKPFRELSETPPEGFVNDLEDAIRSSGFEVCYEPMPEGRAGHTDFDAKRVTVAADIPPARRAKTLAHELGHISAGHGDRLADYHTGPGGCRGDMEVEAESIAYTLCRANGMSTQVGDYSGGYIAGWAGGRGTDAVRKSAESVAKAVTKVLSSHQWSNLDA